MRPNLPPPAPPASTPGRVRAWAAVLGALVVVGLSVALALPAWALPSPSLTPVAAASASQVTSTTSTSEALAGTTLEADSRDDGTALAPWLIWSGIAAGASVLVGGLLLKRRMT